MMKENRMFMLLSVAVIMCLFGLTPIQAQTSPTGFSGNATGVIANANVLGTVTANATVAPTGALPAAGGSLSGDVANANIQLGAVGTANNLTTGVIQTRTSGGADGLPPGTSQSRATVNNLDLGLLAGLTPIDVTATTVQATTFCQCTDAGPSCTGSTTIENLRVNNVLVTATAVVMPPPNTRIVTALLDAAGMNIGTVTLTLNEQIFNGAGDITVNALRIQIATLDGAVTTNIIVAQAHSDIVCAPVASSADLQTTNVCVNSNNVITCTITVTNNGPSTATGIMITDSLSASTTFVSATGSGGATVTSTPTGGATGGTVTGSIATLGSGQSATITVVSNVAAGTPTGTTISNTATVTSATSDLNPGNNTATGTAAVGAADSFSGNATGVIANANVLGTVTANATVAPTGALPAAGGSLSGDVANANIQLGAVGTANNLTTGVIQTRTSGGAAGQPSGTSQSRATVNNLDLTLLGGTPNATNVTATTVQATTFCQCTNTGPVCTGSTTIENLRVNNVLVTATAVVMPPPNTRIVTALVNAAGMNIGTVTLTLNEQTSTGAGDITVNALRIQIAALDGTITTDIIVAQAHSDIVCGDVTIGPTAASATISGRVLTSKGRGLPGVMVVLTNQNGEVKSAMTNPRGIYRFVDIEVGENYFISVKSKRYVFATQSVFFTEELTDIDFMPKQ